MNRSDLLHMLMANAVNDRRGQLVSYWPEMTGVVLPWPPPGNAFPCELDVGLL